MFFFNLKSLSAIGTTSEKTCKINNPSVVWHCRAQFISRLQEIDACIHRFLFYWCKILSTICISLDRRKWLASKMNHTAKVIIHISDHNHNWPESDKLMPIHLHKYALRRNTLCSLIQPSRKSIEPFVELLFLVVNVLPLGLFCNFLVFFLAGISIRSMQMILTRACPVRLMGLPNVLFMFSAGLLLGLVHTVPPPFGDVNSCSRIYGLWFDTHDRHGQAAGFVLHLTNVSFQLQIVCFGRLQVVRMGVVFRETGYAAVRDNIFLCWGYNLIV